MDALDLSPAPIDQHLSFLKVPSGGSKMQSISFPIHLGVRALVMLLTVLASTSSLAQSEDFIVRLTERSAANAAQLFGPDSREHADALDRLFTVYESNGQFEQARPVRERADAIKAQLRARDLEKISRLRQELAEKEQRLAPSDPEILNSLGQLAALNYEMNEWEASYNYTTRAAALVQQRIRRAAVPVNDGKGMTRADAENEPTRELDDNLRFFRRMILSGWALASKTPEKMTEIRDQTFQAAQLIEQTSTGLAASKLAARLAGGNPKLSQLLRERAILSDRSNAAFEAMFNRQTAATEKTVENIEKLLAAIDESIARDFPEYYNLAIPRALSIRETQSQLNADEALLLVFETYELAGLPDTPSSFGHGRLGADTIAAAAAFDISLSRDKPTEKEFAWLITKTDAKWVRIERDRLGISGKIINLRCGLDRTNWIDPKYSPEWAKARQTTIQERCHHYFGEDRKTAAGLPFDTRLANELYQAIFGQFENLVADKHIIAVATGIISNLPLHVLVTSSNSATVLPRTYEDYRDVRWLGLRQPITMLPSVASLELRNDPIRRSSAGGAEAIAGSRKKPYLGVGDPLLGDNLAKNSKVPKPVAATGQKQACSGSLPTVPAIQLFGTNERSGAVLNSSVRRGELADIKALRGEPSLPETADEICAVARAAGATADDVLLGPKATERALKSLDKSRALQSYRVIHFATHGFVVEETENIAGAAPEPALILTPPDIASKQDDGLLTASEIAQLRLDADLIVLSACNSATRERYSGDAFSGLARAFISAGARSIVVSHWRVDSAAAQKLITQVFDELKRDPKLKRAVALQRAMQYLMMKDETAAAHPMYWAPFVVVGVHSPIGH
jgi:CHAT domain-containing protein